MKAKLSISFKLFGKISEISFAPLKALPPIEEHLDPSAKVNFVINGGIDVVFF